MNPVNTHRHATWLERPSEAVAFQRRRGIIKKEKEKVNADASFCRKKNIEYSRRNIHVVYLINNEEGD